jgi:glyoxylase-like metal-dependent hydrolase (beta-lactamase superfamily II)
MLKIAEGVHQLEIPMQRNPLGKTYSYLLQDAGALIDTGIPSDDGLEALERQLSTLSIRVSDIEKIYVTHMHTDHVGLIDRIQEKSSKVLSHCRGSRGGCQRPAPVGRDA